MKHLLLVEDNETIIMGLKYYLEQYEFIIQIAHNIQEAKLVLKDKTFNLIILDIGLPDGNGFELCNKIKKELDTPVIFLTAKDEETDIVEGLDLGADDYIIKPFRNRELVSRINTVLRRYEKSNEKSDYIKYKDLTIDLTSNKVYKNGNEIIFTALEYKILLMLFTNQNILITREQILEKIWDIAGNFVNDNTLTVYIKRIREKLEDTGDYIKTVRGIGYRVGENWCEF